MCLLLNRKHMQNRASLEAQPKSSIVNINTVQQPSSRERNEIGTLLCIRIDLLSHKILKKSCATASSSCSITRDIMGPPNSDALGAHGRHRKAPESKISLHDYLECARTYNTANSQARNTTGPNPQREGSDVVRGHPTSTSGRGRETRHRPAGAKGKPDIAKRERGNPKLASWREILVRDGVFLASGSFPVVS
jgi:hypothetical protein